MIFCAGQMWQKTLKKRGKKNSFLCCLRLWQKISGYFFGITLWSIGSESFLTTRDTLQTQNEKYLRTLEKWQLPIFPQIRLKILIFQQMENGQVPKEVADTTLTYFEQGIRHLFFSDFDKDTSSKS